MEGVGNEGNESGNLADSHANVSVTQPNPPTKSPTSLHGSWMISVGQGNKMALNITPNLQDLEGLVETPITVEGISNTRGESKDKRTRINNKGKKSQTVTKDSPTPKATPTASMNNSLSDRRFVFGNVATPRSSGSGMEGVGNRFTVNHAKGLMSDSQLGAICFLETKTNNVSRLNRMAKSLGFDKMFIVKPLGFASGLTLLWRSNIFNFSVIRNTTQVIHGIVRGPGSNVRVSFAYVRPTRVAKESFWSDCKTYNINLNDPWIMMGDFNDIADNTEQWGSCSINSGRCLKFVEEFSGCGLLDMGSIGVQYSWFRHEGGRTVQRRKLDRTLWNLEAQNLFPEAKSIIMTRTHSDHHPLKFLCKTGNPPRREARPFKFEGAWLTRDDYRDIWSRVWSNKSLDVVGAIEEVAKQSKVWNKDTFGNILGRKSKLQACLKGVQESAFYNSSRGLQVRDVLDSLTGEDYGGPKLNATQIHDLRLEVDVHEVKKAVFGMKKFGSPGPDGIQAAFYQTFWEEVKIPIYLFVKNALSNGMVPIKTLEAFITLIPKKDSPEMASDFRPITLLNVCLKIISKVVVNRMRPIMKSLIDPFQNSFLPRRSTADNIILTQEIVHFMRQKKGSKGLMVVKLDLHKAYDSIAWEFLESTVVVSGFPQNLISLIMFSVRENSISILWNGEKLAPFQPDMGLRQGNPLAPYLFNLVMERLSWDIQEEVRLKN
ncbi:PREDICTED: uncharacterized protein LOC109185202 [Ipomoea nil]|uniref:uncharacterized protein LOC109185202 n=1 Tax=Ipomoea nil TaxID=35883 RepID=UPI000901B853|nr:PREDICTED: uncharacterized protein LOC109185202 [Ipomoea nil]